MESLIQKRKQYVDEHIGDIEWMSLRKVLDNAYCEGYWSGVSSGSANSGMPNMESIKQIIHLVETYYWGIGTDKSGTSSPFDFVLKHYNDEINI